MQKIIISDELRKKTSGIQLHCIGCKVSIHAGSESLWKSIEEKSAELGQRYRMEDIAGIPAIHASRVAYRLCGKDPARYRLSAEALLRRIVRGDGLYRVCNVVDLLNLVSVTTGYSIGGYDADKINGAVTFGIGKANEPYQGIGRGELNIENIPVFRDELGAFGTATSDSVRTSVTEASGHFLMIIIGFGFYDLLQDATEMAATLLADYAEGSDFEIQIIK